jgi:flagellar assembly factor FliW
MKNIDTTRFGEIEIDESQAVHFPEGLLGFPENKDFIIMEHRPGSPFLWLQSLTSPELAFVMTNPFLIKKDYLKNEPEKETLMKSEEGNDTIIFSLVTIPQGKAEKTTVNLLGPIVIDTKSRKARQVILANSGYSHCHPMISG